MLYFCSNCSNFVFLEGKDIWRRGFKIVPLSEDIIAKSFDEKRIRDFEDALQFYSAKLTSDSLITRNKRDFEPIRNEIEVLTPEEFFRKYGYIFNIFEGILIS